MLRRLSIVNCQLPIVNCASAAILFALLVLAARVAAAEPPALTVQECVTLALHQSPRLQAARHEEAAQRVAADRDRPGFRPEVTAALAQNFHVPRVRTPLGDDMETVEPLARTRLEIGVSPGAAGAAAAAAGRRANSLDQAAAAATARTAADVALEAKRAYHGLLAAEQMLGVAEDAVRLAETHHKLVEDMLTAGTAARSDVLRADVEVAEARQGRSRAANGVNLAGAALNRILGRDLDTPVRVEPPGGLPNEPPALQDAVARALQARPDLQVLRAQLAAAETGEVLARGQRQPAVSVSAALSQQTSSAFVPPTLLLAGVVLRWPLLDGERAKHDIAEAGARAAQVRALLAEAEGGIALEVRQAWLALREARERFQVEEKNVLAAEEAATISELRYQAGAATHLETIDARLALRRARTNRAQAAGDAHVARAELERAVGGEL